MKLPAKPMSFADLVARVRADPDRLLEAVRRGVTSATERRYLHWDKLRHLEPPVGLTHDEWWLGVKWQRMGLMRPLPLVDKEHTPFKYSLAADMPEMLHRIDMGAGGIIQMPEQVTNPQTRDQYCISSLMEEAITSSQLEGATTTRPIAKEMIRTGRSPRDRSEQMILNNYTTMQHVRQFRDKPLSVEMVLELHRLVSVDALDDPTGAGRFRRRDERIIVGDDFSDTVFHDPPHADELPQRIEAMCRFANAHEPFIHPVVRSIILHFWLAYDHPFIDGNGRTARALFYWSMLRHGYWLTEYISISHVIRKAPAQYGRAFLYSETDDNDLTYFVLFHLRVIEKAVRDLHDYIHRKTREVQLLEGQLRGITTLNHRQRALVSHAIRHPNQTYTIQSHRASHGVVYDTARRDLHDLHHRGLLDARKRGKTWVYRPVADLQARLASLE